MNEDKGKTPRNVDSNPDPITGAAGAHPVGTGLGAIGVGAVTGAVGGALGGPVGAAAGAVVGAIAGGMGGKAAAEAVNPTNESEYWRKNYSTRPYAVGSTPYEQYEPAYRYGWDSYGTRGEQDSDFERVETKLGRDWDRVKGDSRLSWDEAKSATRDAWDRMKSAVRRTTNPRD